jgi:hypothetical protein
VSKDEDTSLKLRRILWHDFLQFLLYGYGIISSCDGQKFVNFRIKNFLIATDFHGQ